jgi:hypothetical protein
MASPIASSRDENVWQTFKPDLDKIPPIFSELLENYSHIPAGQNHENHIAHILAVRGTVYKANPYPCIGRFRFLELDLASHALYHADVLPRMTAASSTNSTTATTLPTPPIFLDLGTCLSQDLRKLIHDGAPASACYGADIIPAYIDGGYALFNDADRLPRSQFLCPIDIFDVDVESDKSLLSSKSGLRGKVDIIHVTAVFHLFSLAQQKIVAAQCLRLLRRDLRTTQQQQGEDRGLPCILLGKQVGNLRPEEKPRRDDPATSSYRHNEQTWREMWDLVVAEDEFRGAVSRIEFGMKVHKRHQTLQGLGGGAGKGDMPEGFLWLEWWIKIWF